MSDAPADIKEADSSSEPTSALQLGTFLGVFTPTTLTILGVIMYLRMGWVVGERGLMQALLIVVIANAITMLTSLSLSALATNMKVGVGGAYYLISRSFGLALGGAIGIPLYLSQVLSVTLYAYGMAESFEFVLPPELLEAGWFMPTFAAVIIITVGFISSKSTTLALKLQRPIMVLIAASLVSLAWGALSVEPTGSIWDSVPSDTEPKSFWMVFAVFFPAVTGILSGVSLSGDLADAQRSIPRGVLSAVVIGFVIYLIVPVLLARGASPEALRENPLVWLDVSALSWLILPGLWGAVLSSAFGSILSAPRTLQALAADRLAPSIFSRVSEKSGEPVLGLVVSAGVALAAVSLGNLNVVAEWLTVFFLTTYGALNTVACLENLAGDPSYRPQINIPWWASFLGAAGCFIGMFAINPVACAIAILIEIGIFYWINRRSLRTTWGDARSGLWLSLTRYALLQVRDAQFDPRNWRPHILVFTRDIQNKLTMLKLCDGFGQQRGIVTVMTLLEGDLDDHPLHLERQRNNTALLERHGLLGFCQVAAVSDIDAGIITAAQASGFAGLDFNTTVFGWGGENHATLARLLVLTRKLESLEKCTLIYRKAPTGRRPKNLVIWWKGREHNGDLMLLLAHLLTRARGWEDHRIILRSIVSTEDIAAERDHEFRAMLTDIRIPATVEVIVKDEDQSIETCIQAHSQDASLVFLGLPVPPAGEESLYAETLVKLVQGMPDTLLVRNAGPFRGRLV
ncbi:MAG: amino acid permease [Myxococcota bacterium]|nr:amino acid permease [Myxococcota bacterium]